MSFFRRAARDYLVYRVLSGGRHRRGRRHHGRPVYSYGRPRHRHRRRSNVHVSGCCLPIPLGVLAAAAVGGRAIVSRTR